MRIAFALLLVLTVLFCLTCFVTALKAGGVL